MLPFEYYAFGVAVMGLGISIVGLLMRIEQYLIRTEQIAAKAMTIIDRCPYCKPERFK
jgi:hypothetical protein